MNADVSCPICSAVVPRNEVGTRSAVAEVLVFASHHGLDQRQLCRSCAAGEVPSPCVSLCTLDEARTLCRGCGRTVDEITRWREMGAVERGAVRLRLRTIS